MDFGVTTSSGYRFVGGDGTTPWQAIEMEGVSADALEDAEREYVLEVDAPRLGWRADEVVFRSRAALGLTSRRYERVSFGRAGTNQRRRLFFDVTKHPSGLWRKLARVVVASAIVGGFTAAWIMASRSW